MISTHVLDTSKGAPASGVPVKLRLRNGNEWQDLAEGVTNADGRLTFDCEKKGGIYQLFFEVEKYFAADQREFFFWKVPVVFKIDDTSRKYHVPLLLNPYGYSTYRGS